MPEITTMQFGAFVLTASILLTYGLSVTRICRNHERPIGIGSIVVKLHWSVTAWRIAAVTSLAYAAIWLVWLLLRAVS